MIRPLHILLRKGKTFALTISKCSNWPAIAAAKVGLGNGPEILRFRDGFRLKPIPPLRATWGEIFEPAIADLYHFDRAAPDLVIDVGANMGAFACRAGYLQPSAIVHAFEPSEAHADFLAQNIALNSLGNVTLHRAAVTKNGRVATYSQAGSGGSSGLFFNHPDGQLSEIQSTSLSVIDFSGSRSLFLKLDCEGAEGELIEWLCEHLSQLPPQIHLSAEYHSWCPIPRERLLQLLREHGFQADARILFDESYIFASRGKPGGV
jgi:FkbM family methyltransferase